MPRRDRRTYPSEQVAVHRPSQHHDTNTNERGPIHFRVQQVHADSHGSRRQPQVVHGEPAITTTVSELQGRGTKTGSVGRT